MEPLNKKEMTISAAIGLFIGTVCGIMVSLSMVKEHKKCTSLKQENVLLHEIILQQQQELTNAR
jgi:cell division protein ZapA (FtsZ GTPase activity inhibitor)